MSTFSQPIVAITLIAENHRGITLYAPPWEDEDGDEWQGFLGDGAKIVLLGTPEELDEWLTEHPEHDLSDHPAWEDFADGGTDGLQPADDATFDLDAVWELAADEPTADVVTDLRAAVDMAFRIADCCEDGKLRSLVGGTREYRMLTDSVTEYEGKDGQTEWVRLRDVVADSWERAMNRVDSWLAWEGSASEPTVDEEAQEEVDELPEDSEIAGDVVTDERAIERAEIHDSTLDTDDEAEGEAGGRS